MEEVEAMWMEMVVFEIDLTNNWMDRHGFDRCEVVDIRLQTQDVLEVG